VTTTRSLRLGKHQKLFGKWPFSEEREALSVHALVLVGRGTTAARARTISPAHPSSVLLPPSTGAGTFHDDLSARQVYIIHPGVLQKGLLYEKTQPDLRPLHPRSAACSGDRSMVGENSGERAATSQPTPNPSQRRPSCDHHAPSAHRLGRMSTSRSRADALRASPRPGGPIGEQFVLLTVPTNRLGHDGRPLLVHYDMTLSRTGTATA